MRVAMYYSNKDVRIESMPIPKLSEGELLVRVHSSGICGSDLMEWYRVNKAPCVLGHEVAGEVFEVGQGVTGFDIGDKVVFTHHVPCNNCRYCMRDNHTLCDTLHATSFDPGGFAEYIRLPRINVDKGGVIKMPEGLDFDVATFAEPLGCVLRGLGRINILPGDSVLVLGSGMAGLLNIKVAIALGAGRVVATDIHDLRIEAAKDSGASSVFNGLQPELTDILLADNGTKFDHVIVCAAGETVFRQAMSVVEKGGSILLYAFSAPAAKFQFSLNEFFSQGISIFTTYGASPIDLLQAIELLHYGRVRVSDLITHKLELDQTSLGFQLAADGSESLKVIIRPNN
ncbi:MAG TPA: alcohol dehydrogenase [Chloroflexi bacterium]|nr:alcohol dehydrogenase [Chloroflexota bacterium]HCU99264.1 alcohol dehydrogenase [Chloroflexota bacterium]|tara:strand:+ start:1041 stop:2069 length:1029 start_codon:yes stop_codon:yes gene_type:complete